MKRVILKRTACFAVLFVLVLYLIPFFSAPASAAESELPEAFDLRDVDTDGDGIGDACWITPVKCQDPFTTCWGFAAITAAESSILSSGLAAQDGYAAHADPAKGLEELNLSEKHLAYFAIKTVDDPRDPQFGEGLYFSGDDESSARYDTGGMLFYSTGLFASGVGPVHENLDKQFEYCSKEGTRSADDDWNIDDDLRFYQSYVLKESYLLGSPAGLTGQDWEDAVRAFKEVLYSGHALKIDIRADTSIPGQEVTTKYISENWAEYAYEWVDTNHQVAIIGWDDHYPKENFAHKTEDGEDAPLPERDGAWLVKNSWGCEEQEGLDHGTWGLLEGQDKGVYNPQTGKYEYNAIEGALHTGYFWLSYCDLSMGDAEGLDFDSITAEEGYYIAEHDYMPVAVESALSWEDETSMANVFCIGDDIDAARLETISCQPYLSNLSVHVDVYLLNEDWETPTDGVIVSQADAAFQYGGFHKIDLDTPVLLLRDQYFSVVVTERSDDWGYICDVHGAFSQYCGFLEYCVSVVNPRESFYGTTGDWYDLAEDDSIPFFVQTAFEDNAIFYEMDNFPIKAYLSVPLEDEIPRTAANYKDLKQDAWYYNSVSKAIANGIAMGTAPDAFSPEEVCSRAKAVTWLWRAAGMPEVYNYTFPYWDVLKGDYCYDAVLWAKENRVLSGESGGTFAPGEPVTKAQMMMLLYHFDKLNENIELGLEPEYDDTQDLLKDGPALYESIIKAGAPQGSGANFKNDTCTRAQTLCILQRYFQNAT